MFRPDYMRSKKGDIVFSKVIIWIIVILFMIFVMLWFTGLRDEMVGIVNEFFKI